MARHKICTLGIQQEKDLLAPPRYLSWLKSEEVVGWTSLRD